MLLLGNYDYSAFLLLQFVLKPFVLIIQSGGILWLNIINAGLMVGWENPPQNSSGTIFS
jgi:hypothetical protein